MEHDVRSLQALIEARFQALNERMDDHREELREIRLQTTRTNGRLNSAEEQIRTIFKALAGTDGIVAGLVSRVNDVWHSRHGLEGRTGPEGRPGRDGLDALTNTTVTFGTLQWIVVAVISTIVGTYSVLALMGFHK